MTHTHKLLFPYSFLRLHCLFLVGYSHVKDPLWEIYISLDENTE